MLSVSIRNEQSYICLSDVYILRHCVQCYAAEVCLPYALMYDSVIHGTLLVSKQLMSLKYKLIVETLTWS